MAVIRQTKAICKLIYRYETKEKKCIKFFFFFFLKACTWIFSWPDRLDEIMAIVKVSAPEAARH